VARRHIGRIDVGSLSGRAGPGAGTTPGVVLGLVHGLIGGADEAFPFVSLIGEDGTADTDANLQGLALPVHRFGNARGEGLHGPFQVVLDAEVGQQHGEFVAGQAGHGIAGPYLGSHALGDFLQQGIAGLVAVGVVDRLEAVQI